MMNACASEIRGAYLLEWQGLDTLPVVHASDGVDCASVVISAAAVAHRAFGQVYGRRPLPPWTVMVSPET